jgi:hypothetical protein
MSCTRSSFAGGFDMPGDERAVQGRRHFLGEACLAGTGFALDEQWPAHGDGGIDRHHQVIRGHVRFSALELGIIESRIIHGALL